MRITDAARDAILGVLKSKNMDPIIWYMEIKILENGALGLGFTRELGGQVRLQVGDLQLAIDPSLDTEGVLVDFGETKGKRGLLFLPDPSA